MKKRDCCELILNHACDLRCAFCSQADFSREARMTPGEAVRHIYSARKAGFTRLGFSGGEALLRPDLPQLVKAARRVGFRAVRLQTNGMRLSSPAAAGRLVKAGLTVCKFTFASHRPELHDRVVGQRGAFGRSLRGLRNMLRLRVSVGVNILVTGSSFRDLPASLKFFMGLGVANFVIIYPLYEGGMASSGSLGVSLPEAAPFIVEALREADAAGLGDEVKALNVPPCLLPGFEYRAAGLFRFNTVVIGADGSSRDLDKCVAAAKLRGAPCARCFFGKTCRGLDAKYIARFGWKGIRPVKARPARRRPAAGPLLSDREKCFLEALKGKRARTTAQILSAAARLPLCYDCSDGNSVLATGQSLERKGLVARRFLKGAYLWERKDA